MDYWEGPKGMLAPSQIIGGPAPPPPPPPAPPSSYAYEFYKHLVSCHFMCFVIPAVCWHFVDTYNERLPLSHVDKCINSPSLSVLPLWYVSGLQPSCANWKVIFQCIVWFLPTYILTEIFFNNVKTLYAKKSFLACSLSLLLFQVQAWNNLGPISHQT